MVSGRKRILVVEDDLVQRDAISGVIGHFLGKTDVDVQVEEEQTAYDAFARVTKDAHDDWFIVTDYQLPPLNGHPIRDGMDLVRGIRSHSPDVQAHIVFMTGTFVLDGAIDALGVDRFIEKPFVFRAIIEELSAFLTSV